MRQGMLLSALLLAATSVHAGQIHRCVDRKGHVSLQSAPCADGQRLTRSTRVEPASHDKDVEARNARVAAEMDRRNQAARRGSTSSGGGNGSSQSRRQATACSAAKAHRDDVLRRVGLRRTFDLLRQLDDQVYRACR